MMLALAALLVWELVVRSAIPVAIDGTVQSISIKDEHPGTRNVYFVRIGSTTRQVDPATGRHLAVGDRVSKESWNREMRVNDEVVRLKLSREAKASLWFAPLLRSDLCGGCGWRSSAAEPRQGPLHSATCRFTRPRQPRRPSEAALRRVKRPDQAV